MQSLPGIGPERAGRLLDKFGSVEAVISAGSDELQTVYGIGKNVADRIKWAVSEEMNSYLTKTSGPETHLVKAMTLERS